MHEVNVTTNSVNFNHRLTLPPRYCQRATMLYGWEGNCRSGVALAMRHRLQWFIHLPAQWLTRGRWAPRLHSEYNIVFYRWLSSVDI